MPRVSRLDPDGGWHHVMNRGVDRQRIFFDDTDRLEFGRLLIAASIRFGVEIHAYCLMDNHFHLLVRCPSGNLSEAMQWFTGLYARFLNDRTERVGHLFGSRFTSRLLTTHRYIVNVAVYIHVNPTDRRDLTDIDTYRWSSHRTYLGLRRADWMHTDPVLRWCGGRETYRRLVANGSNRGTIEAPANWSPTIEEIIGAIEVVLLERSEVSGRSRLTERRTVGLAIADRLPGELGSDMHAALGIETASALRNSRARARDFLRENPATADLTAPIERLIGVPRPEASAA